MRLILYNPRFPTNNAVSPELDVLPPQFASSSDITGNPIPSSMQTIPVTNKIYTNGGGGTTHPSTIYRVSTSGISVQQPPHASAHSRSYSATSHPHSNSQHPAHHSRPSASHAKTKSSEGGDGSTTPTQSKTLEEARRPSLNQSDLGSLTPEQIAQLQANMLEDLQDSDSRPLVSSVQPMELLMGEYSTNPNFVRKMEWLKKQGWLG
ncbi:hypothetical protein FRC17_003601, partial [Serendipita sp. 399]